MNLFKDCSFVNSFKKEIKHISIDISFQSVDIKISSITISLLDNEMRYFITTDSLVGIKFDFYLYNWSKNIYLDIFKLIFPKLQQMYGGCYLSEFQRYFIKNQLL